MPLTQYRMKSQSLEISPYNWKRTLETSSHILHLRLFLSLVMFVHLLLRMFYLQVQGLNLPLFRQMLLEAHAQCPYYSCNLSRLSLGPAVVIISVDQIWNKITITTFAVAIAVGSHGHNWNFNLILSPLVLWLSSGPTIKLLVWHPSG